MSETPAVVTDQTGIVRSPAGEILPPIAKEPETKIEPKPEGEVKPEVKADDKDKSILNQGEKKDEKKVDAPATYADFKTPEGFTLDAEVAKQAGELFKGMNLNQEQAQSLVDFYIKQTTEAADAPYKAYADLREEWRNKVRSDPELGGKLDEVKSTVSKVIDSLGPTMAKEFREAMDVTGLGDHPAFIRTLYALSKQLTEGTNVKGGGPSKFGQIKPGAPQSAAHALFPNLP